MLKKDKSVVLLIFRIVVGLVFIFSSVVKGIDPLGTAYRVEDYLEAYSWYFMVDYALYLGLLLIVVEFVLGVSMLFRLRFKLGALGVLLIMLIFTTITYFDATLNLVPDCGCFGDAVKLSNWETFYKNIVLIIMAVVIFVMRKQAVQHTPKWFQNSLLALISFVFIAFVYYSSNHLPLMDFRAWKIGNNMKAIGEEDAKVYLTYQNTETGETKEYLSPNYPWSDSLWLATWDFVGQRFDNSSLIKMHELIIEDSLANDNTTHLIENPFTQILVIIPDIEKTNKLGLERAIEISQSLTENQFIAIVTGSDFETAGKFFAKSDIEVYFADDIELKAMIRSNPGIVILQNGVIVKKYHYNDFPERILTSD